MRWKSLDEIAGRETSWKNMCDPKSLFFLTSLGYYVRSDGGDMVQLSTVDELEEDTDEALVQR